MKLAYVRESKNPGYTVLGVDTCDGVFHYTVPTAIYLELGAPVRGESLSSDGFTSVKYYDEIFRATKKALSLLAYSDNNAKTLKLKLLRAGFSNEAAENAVEEMQREGYVNESRQLRRLILTDVKVNLRGRAIVVPKLVAKGYKREDVEAVLDELIDDGEIDFAAVKEALIAKKLGSTPPPEEVKKLLYKNGFYQGE